MKHSNPVISEEFHNTWSALENSWHHTELAPQLSDSGTHTLFIHEHNLRVSPHNKHTFIHSPIWKYYLGESKYCPIIYYTKGATVVNYWSNKYIGFPKARYSKYYQFVSPCKSIKKHCKNPSFKSVMLHSYRDLITRKFYWTQWGASQ